MGKHCDLEVMTSATITTSTDFIIAIIACLATLLRMCLVTKIRTLLFLLKFNYQSSSFSLPVLSFFFSMKR
jgi:hypothetical protein